MNRTLLVAALAATFGTGAFAQSSVEIYGRLNTTVERIKLGDASSSWDMRNNASRIGFKGTEDMGGGLAAGFVIEHGFSPTNGVADEPFWARQSEVNLTSKSLGMLRMGRYTSEAYYATADYVGMHNHDTGTSADVLWAYISSDARKVSYRTPTLGGAWGEVGASMADAGANRTYDAALNWSSGVLSLGGGYTKGADAKMFSVRATVDLSPLVLAAYVQHDDSGIVVDGGSRNVFRVAAMYSLGASEFHVNAGYANDYGNIDDSDAKQWTLAYNYNLSKRTKVYTYFTKVSDSADVTYARGDLRSLAFGVRHNF